MIEWDQVLTWQAQMTDAMDREELEIRAYQSLEQMLLAHRKQAIELDHVRDLDMIDTYLVQVNVILNLKTLLLNHLKFQFRSTMESFM